MDISTSLKDITPSLAKAIALARRESSVLVCEAAQLEGINRHWIGRAEQYGMISVVIIPLAPSILLRLGGLPDNWLDALPKLEEQFHGLMGREDSVCV